MKKYIFLKQEHWNTINGENKRLIEELSSASNFVEAIKNGNLQASYSGSTGNTVASALLSLRDRMAELNKEEQQRNWVNQGVAKFADILRLNQLEEITVLFDKVISNLVSYLNVNQGGMFALNNDNEQDHHLELISCYAYQKKKFQKKRIELGEGLIGQCFLEKEYIYLTEVPQDYIQITSGLGDARPRSILIMPMMLDQEILGVIELASFKTFEKYQIDFVKKIAESIASTYSGVRVAQRTKNLLQESQVQAEQLKSQEEEVRQNMEELSATQEEMQRVLKEVQGKEKYLSELLNASKDSIFTVDRDIRLLSWNEIFQRTQSFNGIAISKGFDILGTLPDAERKSNQKEYARAFAGESFELSQEFTLDGKKQSFLISYSPLRNEKHEIFAVAVFAKDVTPMVEAQRNAERLASEAQQQTEELKAQEEELRQNMEELSAMQEEMERVMKEVEAKEAYTSELLNVSTDLIYTIDKEYKLSTWNKSFAASLERFGMKLEKGMSTLEWFPDEETKNKQIALYKRVFNKGETFEDVAPSEINGETYYFHSINTPLRNNNGVIIEAAIFSKDVTEATVSRLKVQQMLTEAQRQEEYMSALLNVSTDSILTLDHDFKVLTHNNVFAATFEGKLSVGKGFDILSIFDEAERVKKVKLYKKVFAGETIELADHLTMNGFDNYYAVTHTPLRNSLSDVIAISIFAREITALVKALGKAAYNKQAAAMKLPLLP